MEAVHDPVVLFDQRRINTLFARDDPDQIRELRVVVQIVARRVGIHALSRACSNNRFVLSFPYSRTARRRRDLSAATARSITRFKTLFLVSASWSRLLTRSTS